MYVNVKPVKGKMVRYKYKAEFLELVFNPLAIRTVDLNIHWP